MRYWRVTFDAQGRPASVEPLEGPADADWVIVEAETAEAAHRRAVNLYAARKKRERIAQLHANGQCHCSRKQDRPGMLTCSVCSERRKVDHQRRLQAGPAPRVRDEAARVASFQQRSRDRKREIRLEVLLEVRAWWQESAHTLEFLERLGKELLAAGGTGTVEMKTYHGEHSLEARSRKRAPRSASAQH